MTPTLNVWALALLFAGILVVDSFAVDRFLAVATSALLPAWALVLVALLGLAAHVGLVTHAVKTLREFLRHRAPRTTVRKQAGRSRRGLTSPSVKDGGQGRGAL